MKHVRGSKRFGKNNKFFGKMMSFDKFSYSVPTFNFRGDQSIKTGLGSCCSMVLTITVLYYALLKLIQLQGRNNPNIAAFPVEAAFDVDNPINLNDIGFRAAFSFTAYNYTSW